MSRESLYSTDSGAGTGPASRRNNWLHSQVSSPMNFSGFLDSLDGRCMVHFPKTSSTQVAGGENAYRTQHTPSTACYARPSSSLGNTRANRALTISLFCVGRSTDPQYARENIGGTRLQVEVHKQSVCFSVTVNRERKGSMTKHDPSCTEDLLKPPPFHQVEVPPTTPTDQHVCQTTFTQPVLA